MSLSRLFVRLLLSKQAVTPIPRWLSKGYTNTHKHAHTCRRSCVFHPLGGYWGDGLKEGRHADWSHYPICGGWGGVHFVCVWVVVRVCVMEADSNEAEWEGWKHKVCAPALSCFCVSCVYLSISHPAAHQSSPPYSSVCINLLPLSLTPDWSMPQLDIGRAFGILREMSQLSPVKQILCLQQTLGGDPYSQQGGSREMQDDKVSRKICRPSSPVYW